MGKFGPKYNGHKTLKALNLCSMQSFVDYVQNVLGVRELLVNNIPTTKVRLLFLGEASDATETFEAESQELLAKMVQAMKLKPEEVRSQNTNIQQISQQIEGLEDGPSVVLFSQVLFDFLSTNYPRIRCYVCPSPAEMLKNPTLKREAWETLKRVLLQLEK